MGFVAQGRVLVGSGARPAGLASAAHATRPGTVQRVCTVDWGKVIDAIAAAGSVLAAVGAFVAAYFALKIAGQAREDARRESDEGHEAQARLVRVTYDGVSPNRFAVEVQNWGALAILDVALIATKFESKLSRPMSGPQPTFIAKGPPIDVLVPISREALAPPRFSVAFQPAPAADDSPSRKWVNWERVAVHSTVEFTDAYGQHWRQSTDGMPTRIPTRSTATLHPTP